MVYSKIIWRCEGNHVNPFVSTISISGTQFGKFHSFFMVTDFHVYNLVMYSVHVNDVLPDLFQFDRVLQ